MTCAEIERVPVSRWLGVDCKARRRTWRRLRSRSSSAGWKRSSRSSRARPCRSTSRSRSSRRASSSRSWCAGASRPPKTGSSRSSRRARDCSRSRTSIWSEAPRKTGARMTAVSAREAFAAEELPRIEAALERAVGRLEEPVGAAALHAMRAGGKRVRPLLTVASFRAAGGTGDAVYPVAAAAELIHTYSLLHDDLPCMDDDSMRRGIPTAHRVFGERLALAAGAALQHLAFLSLAEAAAEDPDPDPNSADRLLATSRRLAGAAGPEGMGGGQVLDHV